MEGVSRMILCLLKVKTSGKAQGLELWCQLWGDGGQGVDLWLQEREQKANARQVKSPEGKM